MNGGRDKPPALRRGARCYVAKSVTRKLSALRTLFGWLKRQGDIPNDPTALLSTARTARRLPNFLDVEEAAELMETPEPSSPAGLRDRAVLEVLYGAGLRVSELTGMDVTDVNLEERNARVLGKGSKQRMVLLGTKAADAVRLLPATRATSPPRSTRRRRALPQSQRRSAHAAERAEARPHLRDPIRHRDHGAPAHAAPHLRDAPTGRRRGPARGAGTPRALQPDDNGDLHARHAGGGTAHVRRRATPGHGGHRAKVRRLPKLRATVDGLRPHYARMFA